MTHAQLDPIVEEQIERYIKDVFLPVNHVPGMTITIVKGTDAFIKGYGYRNIEQQMETNENTLFGIGSISKVRMKKSYYQSISQYNIKFNQVDFFICRALQPRS